MLSVRVMVFVWIFAVRGALLSMYGFYGVTMVFLVVVFRGFDGVRFSFIC